MGAGWNTTHTVAGLYQEIPNGLLMRPERGRKVYMLSQGSQAHRLLLKVLEFVLRAAEMLASARR